MEALAISGLFSLTTCALNPIKYACLRAENHSDLGKTQSVIEVLSKWGSWQLDLPVDANFPLVSAVQCLCMHLLCRGIA